MFRQRFRKSDDLLMYSFIVSEIDRSKDIYRDMFMYTVKYRVVTKTTPYHSYGIEMSFFTDTETLKVRKFGLRGTGNVFYETSNYNKYQELHLLVENKMFGG